LNWEVGVTAGLGAFALTWLTGFLSWLTIGAATTGLEGHPPDWAVLVFVYYVFAIPVFVGLITAWLKRNE